MIELAPGLRLPLSSVTSSFALVAMKGAGKSNAAVVMAEQLFDAGVPWVCIDPKGDWWGIRSGAGGKGGGLPVPIFGGLHGDVPIDPAAGALFADLIVDQHLTCLIDVSELTKGESIRFLTAFFDRLYRRKNKATYPMHLFLEECDDYVPQKVYREVAGLVRTVELVVKRGRQRGLGITLATQRCASVNKDVLTQTDTLICLRTASPQDRKAELAWLDYNAGAKEIVDELPSLQNGEAWVSSPAQLRILKKVRFHQRRTFDSGATPELGEKVKAASLADIDVKAITAAVAEVVERAAADDPKRLRAELGQARARVAELERTPAVPEVREVEKLVEVEVVPEQVQSAMRAALGKYDLALRELSDAREFVAGALEHEQKRRAPARRLPPAPPARPPVVGTAFVTVDSAPANGELQLGEGHRKILTVLAQTKDGELPRRRLAVMAGYREGAGHFSNLLGALRTAGLLERQSSPVRITAAGREALGPVEQAPAGPELFEWWLARQDVKGFGDPAKGLLRIIAAEGPLPRSALAERAGYSPKAGHFSNMLGRLRTLGLVAKQGDPELDADFAEAIR